MYTLTLSAAFVGTLILIAREVASRTCARSFVGTTAQTLRAKFHTALRINCVGFWGNTRTLFRANVEKKTNVYLCAVFRVHVRADCRADFGSKCFLRRGLRKVQADFRRYLYVSVFFFSHTRAQASAHICAQKFTRILRDYFARNICAQFFANLCATRNEKFTPASIETSGGISVASCPPELPHTHARKLREKP